MTLFHITTLDAWQTATREGSYRPPSLTTEGFIHLSTEAQWPRTAERFFRGQRGLVLLSIEEASLLAEVKMEPTDSDLFPHLYGELNIDAVATVQELPLLEDGSIGTPEE